MWSVTRKQYMQSGYVWVHMQLALGNATPRHVTLVESCLWRFRGHLQPIIIISTFSLGARSASDKCWVRRFFKQTDNGEAIFYFEPIELVLYNIYILLSLYVIAITALKLLFVYIWNYIQYNIFVKAVLTTQPMMNIPFKININIDSPIPNLHKWIATTTMHLKKSYTIGYYLITSLPIHYSFFGSALLSERKHRHIIIFYERGFAQSAVPVSIVNVFHNFIITKLTGYIWDTFRLRLEFHTLAMPFRALHASAFLTLRSCSDELTMSPGIWSHWLPSEPCLLLMLEVNGLPNITLKSS